MSTFRFVVHNMVACLPIARFEAQSLRELPETTPPFDCSSVEIPLPDKNAWLGRDVPVHIAAAATRLPSDGPTVIVNDLGRGA